MKPLHKGLPRKRRPLVLEGGNMRYDCLDTNG